MPQLVIVIDGDCVLEQLPDGWRSDRPAYSFLVPDGEPDVKTHEAAMAFLGRDFEASAELKALHGKDRGNIPRGEKAFAVLDDVAKGNTADHVDWRLARGLLRHDAGEVIEPGKRLRIEKEKE